MKQKILQEEQVESQVPVCGANFCTPVTDVSRYIDEVHYTVGGRIYIENAEDLKDGPRIEIQD